MGANHGASGNKLHSIDTEVSVAVAANRVNWSAQHLAVRSHDIFAERLDASGQETPGEKFATSVVVLVKAAFSEIERHGSPADSASLIAKLNEVLGATSEKTTAEPSDSDFQADTTKIVESLPMSAPVQAIPPQFSMIEQTFGSQAMM